MTLFANRRRVANLAYWVTGTEGSNPSLSASQTPTEFRFPVSCRLLARQFYSRPLLRLDRGNFTSPAESYLVKALISAR